MNVTELRVALENAELEGKGNLPVQMMHVEQGVTFAVDLHSAFLAQPYDGERFWLIPKKERIPPDWAGQR